MGGSTVAVTTTWNSDAQPGAVGAAVTEQLTTALVDSGRFVVLERAALGEVLGEQGSRAADASTLRRLPQPER